MSETTVIHQDGENEEIGILRVDADGAAIVEAGSIKLKLVDAEGNALKVGRIHYPDQNGTAMRFWGLRSAGVEDVADDNNGEDDVFIGGSGSGGAGILMELQGADENYLIGRTVIPRKVAKLTAVLATGQTTGGHGVAVGTCAAAVIAGAAPAGYNGSVVITATGANTFTYPIDSALAAASGSITVTIAGTAYDVSSLTSAIGTTVTVTTAVPHGLPPNWAQFNGGKAAKVIIAGADPADYNGTFSLLTAPATHPRAKYVLTYQLGSAPASSPATGTITFKADTPVAKDYRLRIGNLSAVEEDGLTYDYTYSAGPDSAGLDMNKKRTKTQRGTSTSEDEYVTPGWISGEQFYGAPVDGTNLGINGSPILLAYMGTARGWAT